MQRLLKPLAVVLAVPLLCTAIALAARERLDDRWQAGLRRQFALRRQPVNERLIARYSLGTLCADRRAAATIPPCRPYRLFTSMGVVSFLTGAFGLFFLGGLAVAARACRSSRATLVRLFAPALYGAIAALVLLMLLHGALAIAGVYLLGEVIEGWPSSIVFAIAVAALLAALSMIQVALMLARRARASVVGRVLDAAAQPRVAAFLTDAARAVGSGVPRAIVAGLSPGLFVTEAPVLSLDGRCSGPTMYLSLPLARILTVGELRALVAHELAHFAGGEEEASRRLYPVFAGISRGIESVRHEARGLRSAVIVPALWVLSFFLEPLLPAIAAHARSRELAADAAAARLGGAEPLAAALLKAHAFTPAWDAVSAAMEQAVSEGTQYTNAAELFEQVVAGNVAAERLASAWTHSLWHPTDSLPALGARLDALGVALEAVQAAGLATRPADPAISLFENHELLERDLSEVEHRILATSRIRHAEA